MWDISMMAWRVGQILEIEAQFDWIQQAGFEAVSFHASPGVDETWRGVDPKEADSERRAWLRRRLSSFTRCEIHAPFSAVLTPEEPMDTVEQLKPIIRFAGDVGAAILTVHAHPPEGANLATSEWMRALHELNAQAGEAAITIGLENIPGEPWFQGPRWSNVGVTLDIGHWLSSRIARPDAGSSLGDAVRALGDSLVHLHLHDHDGIRDHLGLGTGLIDWTGLLQALSEIDYGGFLCLELNPDAVSPEEMRAGREWLRNRFAQAT